MRYGFVIKSGVVGWIALFIGVYACVTIWIVREKFE